MPHVGELVRHHAAQLAFGEDAQDAGGRRDRGVLAVLDPRLQTKGYGRRFIASLPPAPIVRDLDAVEAFFSIV